mmetsp:Transcript_10463/g.31559  ORF Transcript_10463/g.31559 Transcript_10463/m.31559 type:complete len:359 (+) Transcript_10463:271-1347(+)
MPPYDPECKIHCVALRFPVRGPRLAGLPRRPVPGEPRPARTTLPFFFSSASRAAFVALERRAFFGRSCGSCGAARTSTMTSRASPPPTLRNATSSRILATAAIVERGETVTTKVAFLVPRTVGNVTSSFTISPTFSADMSTPGRNASTSPRGKDGSSGSTLTTTTFRASLSGSAKTSETSSPSGVKTKNSSALSGSAKKSEISVTWDFPPDRETSRATRRSSSQILALGSSNRTRAQTPDPKSAVTAQPTTASGKPGMTLPERTLIFNARPSNVPATYTSVGMSASAVCSRPTPDTTVEAADRKNCSGPNSCVDDDVTTLRLRRLLPPPGTTNAVAAAKDSKHFTSSNNLRAAGLCLG